MQAPLASPAPVHAEPVYAQPLYGQAPPARTDVPPARHEAPRTIHQTAAPPQAPSRPAEPPAPAPIPAPAEAPWAADPILPREAAPAPRRPFVPEPAAEPRPEGEILAALSQGLEVHLQPIVSLPQRKVAFYEALARLRVGDALLGPRSSCGCWSGTGAPPSSTG